MRRLLLTLATLSMVTGVAVSGAVSMASATVSSASRVSSVSATGTPWLVGSIIDETGSGAAEYNQTASELQAWVKYTNAHGGINGHSIKLDIVDDESSPSVGLQAANELINDHVIALVEGGSTVAAAWAATIQKAGIPVVCGSPAAAPPWGMNSDFYPCVPGASTETDLIVKAAVAEGKKKIGVAYCVEVAACSEAADAMKASAAKFGATITPEQISLSAPSYAAPCLAMKNAGDQVVFPLGSPTVAFSIITQCGQQGFKPAYIAASVTNQWLTDPDVRGFIGLSESFPWFENTPVAETYRAAMRKYFPTALSASVDDGIGSNMWSTGLLFEAAAEAGHLGNNPTPKEVTAGLNKLSNNTLGGATAPLTFTHGNRDVTCAFVISQKGGHWTTPEGPKAICDAAG
jgi:branched-chain amino acid transport system substrate-binding protein